jgi:hypothetical protein
MAPINGLPVHLQQRLRAELRPGESLVWAGQPNPDVYMQSGYRLWFFFAPWTLICLALISAALDFRLPRFDSPSSFFPLIVGVPFLLAGFGFLSSPLRLRRKARSIVYAITYQRAISIEGAKPSAVKSYLPCNVRNVELNEHADGSGDLILVTEHYRDSEGDHRTTHGFFSIDNVRYVAKLFESVICTNQR